MAIVEHGKDNPFHLSLMSGAAVLHVEEKTSGSVAK